MDNHVLSALHLSSVFASSGHVPTHAVPTARRDIPLAVARSDISDEHASFSSLFHSVEIGRVLIRVIQGGLAVELVSLSHNVSPIRFDFPASVIPNPSLAIYEGQVYLIVLTSVGSLFRLALPCTDDQLWHGPLPRNWCKEWQIKKLGTIGPKLMHVHDTHDVAIALRTGGYLRLENKSVYNRDDVHWTETEWRSANWYSAFLPVISSSHDYPEEIISMSTAPSPTDMSDMFSISRSRVLRRWTIAKGCRAELALDPGKTTDETPFSLLDSSPQKLLQVFTAAAGLTDGSDGEESVFVLIFLPSSSLTSGGSFRIYNTDRYQWSLAISFNASPESAHCRLQDFLLSNGTLYVLWERQGESMLEMSNITLENLSQTSRPFRSVVWSRTRLDHFSKINQGAMDELLLQPGSLTNKFLQSILRPGLFSAVTLRAALQDYKQHYLALPGPQPAPLLASYSTLSENISAVVGCTVALTRDSHTGAMLHSQYWKALRRDWEGFVARCTEIERSARWPMCLGLNENGQVLVIERERICQCIEEDMPMRLYRQLHFASHTDSMYPLLDICWALRTKLPEPLVRRIETESLNIFREGYVFPLADILAEAASKVSSKWELEEDHGAWVSEKLSSFDFDSAVRAVLEVIISLDKGVKQEEDEVEMIIPPSIFEWTRALAASYLIESIEARYEMCLSLSVLFFFIPGRLKTTDPVLLAEAFVIIRGVAMCRYLCRQPAGDPDGTKPVVPETASAEDVATRLSSMHVSRWAKNPLPSYSLVHRLLSEYRHPPDISAAVHHFIERLGLLNNETPSHTSRSEAMICEKLRHMGYRECARYLLSWLPRTPAVSYVLGRLWIDVGREDEAATLLQGVSGSFGSGNLILSDDLQSLDAVLPNGCCRSDCEYYLQAAELFKKARMTSSEVHFLRLALSVWPEGGELDEVSLNAWASIIKGCSDLGLYDDAYCYLVSSPHYDQRQQYVSDLIYRICENNALDRLISMNFRGLVQEVESALSFKARNADPHGHPNWSQILYTWYTVRGDYRNAALTMYVYYRKLSGLRGDPEKPTEIVEQQLNALSIAKNALQLVEYRTAFIIVRTCNTGFPPRKRRKVENYFPEDLLTSRQHSIKIVKLEDIAREYTHLTANMELLRRDKTLMRHGEPPLTPWLTVTKLMQANLFDQAMHTAQALSVDMSELFQRLSLECLCLSRSSASDLMKLPPLDWLLTDKVASWQGPLAEKAWRYLRLSLNQYDSAETHYSYSKAVLETLLSNDSSPPPSWLLETIERNHPEHLIRTYLRHGHLEEALERSLKLVRRSTTKMENSPLREASCTWLPYSVFDAALKSTEENISPQAQKLRESLQAELSNRILQLRKQADPISSY